MSEDQGTNTPADSGADEGSDPIKQLKGETHRKFDKLGTQLSEMQRGQQQLAEMLQSLKSPPPKQAPKEDLESLMYSDNAKYRAILKEQVENEVFQKIDQRNAAQQQTQSVISELASEYPELADNNNELTKKSVAILKSLPPHEQNTTTAYRYAVKQAAEELSVKPRSKRGDDEFMGPSYNAYGAPQRRRERSDKQILTDVSPLAEAMGLDMGNAETAKRVVERSKRSYKELQAPLRVRKGK
jgi:hypothetical protein